MKDLTVRFENQVLTAYRFNIVNYHKVLLSIAPNHNTETLQDTVMLTEPLIREEFGDDDD